MTDFHDIRGRFEGALEAIVAKAGQDPYILAVILLGSLSHDVVWEKSDIDLFIVTQEVKSKTPGLTLDEAGVAIHASIVTRSRFKQLVEGALGSSFTHSLFGKGRIVFSRDETIDEIFASRPAIGSRDLGIALLSRCFGVMFSTAKAEKWLVTRQDPIYSFFWIMKAVDSLAALETVRHGEVPAREVVQQAMTLNPNFMRPYYTDLIEGPKTVDAMSKVLASIDAYLLELGPQMFAPIYDYLSAASIRSATEVDDYFSKNYDFDGAHMICEWMADHGLIDKVSTPVHVTERSRVDFQEAAFHFGGES